jgi:hypothetical protein
MNDCTPTTFTPGGVGGVWDGVLRSVTFCGGSCVSAVGEILTDGAVKEEGFL